MTAAEEYRVLADMWRRGERLTADERQRLLAFAEEHRNYRLIEALR